jgi:L-threonylcarbamoyladenylate synthase
MGQLHYRIGANVIRNGGLIAYPTESVFGLGCDPFDRAAVFNLLDIKERDWRKGFILVSHDFDNVMPLLKPLSQSIKRKVLDSWPGPTTWLLPAQEWVPSWLRGEHDSLAIRISGHPVVSALCARVGMPIISTSANRSGHRPAKYSWQLRARFGDELDYIVPGPLGTRKTPTIIRDAITDKTIRK